MCKSLRVYNAQNIGSLLMYISLYIEYIPIGRDFTIYKSIWYILKIIFQISNKLADLVPRLTRNTFEFWLSFLQGINIAKKSVNIAKTGVNLAVLFFNYTCYTYYKVGYYFKRIL